MSPDYFAALAALDQAMERLAPLADDPECLVIVMADHGGGGVLPREHDHPHPANEAIPLALLGGRVAPGGIGTVPVRLLDVVPTVLFGFGGTPPAVYQGRLLHEAFVTEMVWV
jgi:arylsulfatase A-like enzyme